MEDNINDNNNINVFPKLDSKLKMSFPVVLIVTFCLCVLIIVTIFKVKGLESEEKNEIKTISSPVGDVKIQKGNLPNVFIVTFSDGTTYEGQFNQNGIPHGRGKYRFFDGGSFDGELKKGITHGYGISILSDGSRYEGQFIEGRVEGQGVEKLTDGSRYEGGWKNDKYHGQGIKILSNGTKYVGQFREGLFHGKGSLILTDGTQYDGSWIKGNLQNDVIVTYPDGNRKEIEEIHLSQIYNPS